MRTLYQRIHLTPALKLRGFHASAGVLSHIGSAPVKYTSEVQIEHLDIPYSSTDSRFFNKTTLKVCGPLGELRMPIEPFVNLKFINAQEDKGGNAESQLVVGVKDNNVKKQRSMWGTTRALIQSYVIGVSEGYSATLRLFGVGYRAAIEKEKLVLRLGYSHPVVMDVPEGIKATTPSPTRILLNGINLQQIKQYAAKIREWKKPEPYNQKGIFINDETIRKKDGKKK